MVLVMHKWNGMLYASLLVQMVSSSGFDYGLASTSGLDLGATGIAYSSIASSIVVFAINLFVIWYKLGFSIEGKTQPFFIKSQKQRVFAYARRHEDWMEL